MYNYVCMYMCALCFKSGSLVTVLFMEANIWTFVFKAFQLCWILCSGK